MKTFNIKIQDKRFRISIRKFIEIVLIRDQSDNWFIETTNRAFFYILLYSKIANISTLFDVIIQVYPAQTDFIKTIIYGASDPTVIRDIIIRYNKQVNNIIDWTKENEDYIQTVIQEIQTEKHKQE